MAVEIVNGDLLVQPVEVGGAVMTSAGRLPYKAIIHVAGINMFWRATEESIRQSSVNAALLAVSQGFASLAFPIIGAGSGGFPKSRAVDLMTDSLETFSGSLRILIVDFKG